MQKQIIEIAFEIKGQAEFDFLESLITRLGIAFYIEPKNRFNSLEDVECQCEEIPNVETKKL